MIYLSFDQDWAPEWATRDLADLLVGAGQKATFFVTHPCPALGYLRESGYVELGWHPNFLSGSSHGKNLEDILDTLARWVPEAQGVRAHCLIQGTPHLLAYRERNLSYEASDLRDGVHDLKPFMSWTGLVQLAAFFEDDVYLHRGLPLVFDALEHRKMGMKIFSFHPVLLALNCVDLGSYQELKKDLSLKGKGMADASREDFEPFSQSVETGVRDILVELLEHLQKEPHLAGGTLGDLASRFRAEPL